MQVQFNTNIGARDANLLGINHADCLIGAVADLPEDVVSRIREVCGKGSVGDVVVEEPPVKPAKPAKVEPTDAELDKLTDPKKK